RVGDRRAVQRDRAVDDPAAQRPVRQPREADAQEAVEVHGAAVEADRETVGRARLRGREGAATRLLLALVLGRVFASRARAVAHSDYCRPRFDSEVPTLRRSGADRGGLAARARALGGVPLRGLPRFRVLLAGEPARSRRRVAPRDGAPALLASARGRRDLGAGPCARAAAVGGPLRPGASAGGDGGGGGARAAAAVRTERGGGVGGGAARGRAPVRAGGAHLRRR